MLLEIENALFRRVHAAIGHSAHVIRLAEEIEASGTVFEQTSVVVSFVSANTENPHLGAYIPTVRKRILTYSVTIISKQSQREGHSFALPILDIIADSVTGWIPKIPNLQFHTGFEIGTERFAQVTEASQFVYEQNYNIEVTVPDGRFSSFPCPGLKEFNLCEYLPERRCLVTPEGVRTGLAIWRRRVEADFYEEWIVRDTKNCPIRDCDALELFPDIKCKGKFKFTPCEALEMSRNGELILAYPEKIVEGEINNVWEFCNDSDYPPWCKFHVKFNLWRSYTVETAKKCPTCKVLTYFTPLKFEDLS